MGYSIATRCKNKGLQKKIVAFMEKNYRGWSVIGGQSFDYSRFCSNDYPENSRLSYDRVKLAVGFDFNACEPERDYIFMVVRWMALKVGGLKKFKDVGSCPYIAYDGGGEDGYWPVIVRGSQRVPVSRGWCLTTATGFRSMEEKFIGTPLYEEYKAKGKVKEFYKRHLGIYHDLCKGGYKGVDKIIKAELDRLDKLWGEVC